MESRVQMPEPHTAKRRLTQLGWAVLAAAAVVFPFLPHGNQGGQVLPEAQRRKMPEVVMPDLANRIWKLSDHRGRVVLVNFWASWCPPCRDETPGFVKLAAEYRNRAFDMAGVSMDDSDAPVRQFVKSYRVPYPVLLPQAETPLLAAIESLPSTFLVDREGRIATHYVGEVSEAAVRADVDRLLAEP
jgi:cytochrome c biogenesis protein CcmG/thiol:disulfide interchange protein DsbE